MPQPPSIPYLIYQSIIEFAFAAASLFPPRLWFTFSLQVPATAPHSFCAAPLLPFLSFTTHRLARSYRLLACFRFSSRLPKNATETPPINQSLYRRSIFFFFTPSPLLRMMYYVLRGEHFHPNRLTVSNKEDGSGSQEKGTGRFTSAGITHHFQCPHLILLWSHQRIQKQNRVFELCPLMSSFKMKNWACLSFEGCAITWGLKVAQ